MEIGVTVQLGGSHGAGLPVFGLRVVELESGGDAQLSGMLLGDVILGVNGKLLTSPEQLSASIQAVGHSLSLDVLRQGRLKVCEVTVTRESVAEVA